MEGIWRIFAAALAATAIARAAAVEVRTSAEIRSACSPTAAALAQVEAGERLKLRFAVASAVAECAAVSLERDGKVLLGYVPKRALADAESLDEARRAAPNAAANAFPPVVSTPPQSAGAAGARDLDGLLVRAQSLLATTRASEARTLLEQALAERPDDPDALALAAVAALQQDDRRQALHWLDRSLELRPRRDFEKLRERILRELEGDRSDAASYGTRMTLRFESEAVSPQRARDLVRRFETEIQRITFRLGCRFEGGLTVVAQSVEGYRETTGAADWSGGRYDGRLHLALRPGAPPEEAAAVFAHEFVHACLARKGAWPIWLHEGVAQLLTKGPPSAADIQFLAELDDRDGLPTVTEMRDSWGTLDARDASIAYRASLAAADLLVRELGDDGFRSLLNRPERLATLARGLEDRLRATLHQRAGW